MDNTKSVKLTFPVEKDYKYLWGPIGCGRYGWGVFKGDRFVACIVPRPYTLAKGVAYLA